MEIIHPDGSKTQLFSKENISGVTRAEQTVSLLADDIVNISVQSATPLQFALGDRIDVFGKTYTLNQLPAIRKNNERNFNYDLVFEGVQYELLDAQFLLPDETAGDSFTGNLFDFLKILISNANRVFPNKWTIGEYPNETEYKTLTFTGENCLSVLQRLCEEYKREFEIIQQANGARILHIRIAGVNFPYTFKYGRTGGLYELTRQNINSKNVVTRLFAYGGGNNIPNRYFTNRGSWKLCLPQKNKNTSYIQDDARIASFGLKENTKTFDDIFPNRYGEVTSKGSKYYIFADNTMPFDLNEKDSQGNTLWLIHEVDAKVHFNTGNLAGYEFDVHKYDHATKTIELVPFTDENGMKFPSETNAAFQFASGDKYFFIDINLPDAYITEAEQKLKTEAEAYYAQNSQPQVQYGLNIDENFIKQFAGDLTVVNLFGAGDYIPIQDEDMGIADQSVRITGFTRDLLRPYKYAITLGGSVTKSIYNRLIADQMIIDQIIEINNLADPSKARRNWRASQEVLSMVFDPEGDYYSEKIKPASIETNMLQVGAKSMQFVLQNVIFEPNYQSNPNYIRISGGSLVHYTIEETIRSWTFSAVEFSNLVSNTAYYIYARCQRNGNTGSILLDTTQRKVEYEATFYTFWIGVLNSVVTDDGGLRPARLISLTYGSTTINGRFIKTGRILSSGGSDTYFDLDNGEIGGKIVFKAGSSGYQNIIDAPDLSAYDEAVNYIDNVLPASIERLQAQIDDTIESWFYHYNPTLSNIPASDWTTSDDKEKHLDDTFTNLDTGQSWRFTKNSNNVYSWTLMADTAASEALVLAGKAQDTADGKRRVFTGTPYPPYDVGDLWVQGTSGDLMRCATSRLSGSYVASDWVKAVKYTDDTAASNAYSRASSALSAAEAASNAANSASSVAGSAQSAANMAARVFYNPSAPTSGMKTNDLWVNGSLIYRYNGSSWVNADKYDVQMTIVNGGLVSTGAIVFGQTGGMAATGSVRIWSGGSNGVVGSGTFRVLSTGAVYARNSVNIEDPNGRIVCGLSSDGTTDGSSLDNPGSIRIWAGGTSASSGKFRVTQYGYVFGVQFITNGLKGRMDDVGFQFGDYGDSNPYAYLHTNNNPLFRLRSNYTPFEVIYSGGLAGTAINITNTGDNGYFQLGFYRYSSESIARPTIRWTTPIYSNHLPNRTKRNVCWDESSGYMYVE